MSQDHTWFGPVAISSGFTDGGPAGLGASFAHLVCGAQQPVHGGDRGQVDAFVEQRGPDWAGAWSQNRSELSVATITVSSAA